ncbi:hypothetical protein CYMTET_6095 [Cymbomonas tetramitiformis]|uniref:Uncharacterized protein n=1 Tax=Cymbomonas tetramitiformis TaxID=36881 RepID=A0AAE0GYC8_9CHLO|nr:hypothetical protein CYMTET_6095 [Cymbomonas tetramitiformis]
MVNSKSKATTSGAEENVLAAGHVFGEPPPDDKPEVSALTVAVSQQQAQINELMELVRGIVKSGLTAPKSDGATSTALTSKTSEDSDAPLPSLSSIYAEGRGSQRTASADGCAAWQQLAKLRRNTNYTYFNCQMKELLSHSAKFSALTPPLHIFLKVKETFTRVREHVSVAPSLVTGDRMCVHTLEAMVVSMILISLHSDYVYVKTKFLGDRLPRLHVLEDEVCAHYDNIIAPSSACREVGAGIADDRRQQNAIKKARLGGKVECSTCHRRDHDTKDCFITNKEARETFLKRRPDAKEALMQKVQEYEKHGKLPGSDKAGAIADSELHPGLDWDNVLFALFEVAASSRSDSVPLDFSGVQLSEFMEVRGGASRARADRRQSMLNVPTSNYYGVLDVPVATEDCTVSSTSVRSPRLLSQCFYQWRTRASRVRRASMKETSKKRRHMWDPSRHTFLLNKHRRFPVTPVYNSFVYIDTTCSLLPDPARLAATQSV